MNAHEVFKSIAQSVPIANQKYCGPADDLGLRSGEGCQKWTREYYYQTYRGPFLRDNIHGKGTYTWLLDQEKRVYEGNFYINNIEGYGRVSYTDGGSFEGLFRSNRRFGPGVLTYPNATQDVGLWDGNMLMRLSAVVNPNRVPRLGNSSSAKIKLLKYRRLVPICDKAEDIAKVVLEYLGANEEILARSSELYNPLVRDQKSIFFNNASYQNNFFGNKECRIEVALSPEEKSNIEIIEHNTRNSLPITDELIGEEEEGTHFLQLNITELCDFPDPKKTIIEKCGEEIVLIDLAIADFQKEISAAIQEIEIRNKDVSKVSVSTEDVSSQSESSEEKSTESLSSSDIVDSKTDTIIENAKKKIIGTSDRISLLMQRRNKLLREIEFFQNKDSTAREPENNALTKEVLVTHLLTWNNEKLSERMLQHTFIHRYSEKCVSFSISKLLSGQRKDFRNRGLYEENCVSFLKKCSNGKTNELLELVRKHNINPDLTDAKGNSGIIFATSGDKVETIKSLVNFGGKIDIVNDEGLTPLTIIIARYIAIRNKVTNWGKAFLSDIALNPEEVKEVNEWHPHVSFVSLLSQGSEVSMSKSIVPTNSLLQSAFEKSVEIHTISEIEKKLKKMQPFVEESEFQESYLRTKSEDDVQMYLLNTGCIKPLPPNKVKKEKSSRSTSKKEKGKSSKSSKSTTTPKQNLFIDNFPLMSVEEEHPDVVVINKLKTAYKTFLTLIKCGANPNLGEVPLPPLILSVYTKNAAMVRDLLENKADPNIKTLDENMSALHVLVSLPPCPEFLDICKSLLQYNADPNSKTNTYHWMEEKYEIIRNNNANIEDHGKTVLHLLSMRYDFSFDYADYLGELCDILVQNGSNVYDRYLGHTPLSLAILRGNLRLMERLLETDCFNANHLLGENMGVPLTVLILKRYCGILPFDTCEKVYDLLLRYKANPLNDIEDAGNAVEFMVKEHAVHIKPKRGGKGSKRGKAKGKVQELVKTHLLECARNTLLKHVQSKALTYLYEFVTEDQYEDELSIQLARFFTLQQLIERLQLFIHYGKVEVEKDTYRICYDLVEFAKRLSMRKKKSEVDFLAGLSTKEIVDSLELQKKDIRSSSLTEPEFDTSEGKYIICFYCCQKISKELYLCPECEMVYFCSEICNKSSNRENNMHTCRSVFYNKEKRAYDLRLKRGEPGEQSSRLDKKLELLKELRQQKDLEHKRGMRKSGKTAKHSPFREGFDIETEKIIRRSTSYDNSRRKNSKRKKSPKPVKTIHDHEDLKRQHHKRGATRSVHSKRTGSTKRTESGRKAGYLTGKSRGRSTSQSGKKARGGRSRSPERAETGNIHGKESKYIHASDQVHGDTRIPNKYQYFLQVLSQIFPNFDLSHLHLPYACFTSGQLYYRFLDSKPIFVETYSSV